MGPKQVQNKKNIKNGWVWYGLIWYGKMPKMSTKKCDFFTSKIGSKLVQKKNPKMSFFKVKKSKKIY